MSLLKDILHEGYNTAVGSTAQGEGQTGSFGNILGVVNSTKSRTGSFTDFFSKRLGKKETDEDEVND